MLLIGIYVNIDIGDKMLVNMNDLLNQAKINKYAIPQFNINNLEWTKYILETCQELSNPVILGVSESAIKYMGGYNTVVNVVVGLMIDLSITIPVVLHLDHGSSFESCKKAIDAGFTSVMIDGSSSDIEENLKITSQVVEYAYKYKVSVEGEIGIIGREDIESKYANVDDCVLFTSNTGIDALAPAVGSMHGLYKEAPKLDFKRIKEISESTNLPLVLHGGTGIPDIEIKEAIKNGICKININTDLQVKWAEGVRKYINDNKDIYDPRKIISSGKENIINRIKELISLFNLK